MDSIAAAASASDPAGRGPSWLGPVYDIGDLVKRRAQGGITFELSVPRFTAAPGQLVAIVGESGCGKSTLLNMLGLILSADEGRFRFRASLPTAGAATASTAATGATASTAATGDDGYADVQALWQGGHQRRLADLRRRDIGYVLQAGGLFRFLTVRGNAHLPATLSGLGDPTTTLEERAQALGITSILDKKPGYLSGGQRQRAAILRAIANDPRVVLADEPTAAVDRTRKLGIVEILRNLAHDLKRSVIVVTHEVELIRHLADITYTFDVTQLSTTHTRSICRPVDTP